MPLHMLHVSAELENITNLQPQGGCDDPNHPYYFKLKCENCGEVTPKHSCVVLNEKVALPTGRDTAQLVQKCKLCGRDGNIKMITGCSEPLTLEMSQSQKSARLMLFDCRGYEPVEFQFADGWEAESSHDLLALVTPLRSFGWLPDHHSFEKTCLYLWPWKENFPFREIWGTTFDIDLSQGDFAEYDEKGQEPVGVSNVQGNFKVAHKISSSGGRVRYT